MPALDYQWAGTYKKKLWDPLAFYRGYPAAPILSQARQGTFWRAQPVHNELGYQMVLLRDDGVPVGGERASTPDYVFAGPIQAGYMDFIRPIMRREQMPRVPPSELRIPREQSQAMTGPYGGGPYARRPLQPPGFATVENGIQGDWPTYQYRPVAPMRLPPPSSSVPEMANTNPGSPPRKKENVMNWVSPNQVARATISNPCINPMPGSGPGYHGYLSRHSNGMGPGSAPSYATMSMRQPNPCGGIGALGVSPNQVARASIRAGNPCPMIPNPGCIGNPPVGGPLQPTVSGPLGITRPWVGMRRRATNPEACCDACAKGHDCEGGCSTTRAHNPAPKRPFFSKVAAVLGLTAPGSGPMPALGPGECAGYTGQGGQSVTCCKGKIFSSVSCFSYDYPGGQRRRVSW